VEPLVLAAVPSPFTDAGDLDLSAATTLYRALLDPADGRGLAGLLVAGTTGEFPALDDDERLALTTAALAVGGPSRVIAHIGGASARQAIRLGRAAVDAGARRVAAITPYYLALDDDGVLDYFREVSAAVLGAGAEEFYAYLFAERTGYTMPPTVFGRVAALPGVVGAKLSGGSALQVAEHLAQAPGAQLLCGTDAGLADAVAAGAAGAITGLAAAFPRTTLRMAAALAAHGPGSGPVRDAQRDLDRALLASGVGGIKTALAARGTTTAAVRMPVPLPDPETSTAIAALAGELD